MSTSSIATTLAEIDPTLGDEIDIGNQICILVTTWGDSTPLGPTSFEEEDVKLCVRLGQEHPDCVLQLLDTEAFLAFQHDTDMMPALCHLTAAKDCWGEPIVLHILPPKGR